jgi:hypothetical protein
MSFMRICDRELWLMRSVMPNNKPDESNTWPMPRQVTSSCWIAAITVEILSSLGIARRKRTWHLVSSEVGGYGDRAEGVLTHGVASIVTRCRNLITNDMLVHADQMSLEFLL